MEAGSGIRLSVVLMLSVVAIVAAQTPKDESADATAFSAIVEHEVSQLNQGITLAKWMDAESNPDDWRRTSEKEITPTDGPRQECLSYMKRERLPSGAEMGRAVYFYPPPPPSPATFPTLSGQELIKTCVLAVIRVEADAPALVRARTLDQAVQQRLTKQYGESVGMKNVAFWGPLRNSYEDAARWIPNAEIVSGYDVQGLLLPDDPPLVSAPFVFVHARLPLVQELRMHAATAHRDRSREAAEFRRAIAASGVDAALSQRIEKLYEVDVALSDRLHEKAEETYRNDPSAPPVRAEGSDWREPLLPVLQDWFRALKTSDTAHRAAGLFAADRLLTAFGSIRPWSHFGGEKSSTPQEAKLRSALEGLGAVFATGFEDDSYHYTGNWLDQAKGLNPDSEGGRLATITWMSSGDACGAAGGSDAFRKVISEGETLLAKKIDAATAAEVHFMVGDAYSDIVAIVGGESGPNGEYDPSQYEGEGEADRAKALEHYRAGLAIDNTSENAKDAWRQAWHLAAGLLPNQRYVCFGD